MGVDLFSLLVFSGMVLGFFLALVFAGSRGGNRLANRLLAVLLGSVVAAVSNVGFFIPSGLYRGCPHLLLVPTLLILLWGPFLLLYSSALTQPSFRLRPRHALHLLPCLIAFLGQLPFFLDCGSRKIEFIERWLAGRIIPRERTGFMLLLIGITGQLLFYIRATKRKIGFHRQRNGGRDAFQLDRQVAWMRCLTNSFACIGGVLAVLYFSLTVLGLPFALTSRCVSIFFILLTGLVAYEAFGLPEAYAGANRAISMPAGKYRKAGFPREEGEKYYALLRQVMRKEKPYTEPDLTLAELAGLVGLSTNHLSQVINQHTSQNFYDFVNQFRIEEAKRLLGDQKRRGVTILELALEAGFNSKSTFNKAFRKFARVSPTDYRLQAVASKRCKCTPLSLSDEGLSELGKCLGREAQSRTH